MDFHVRSIPLAFFILIIPNYISIGQDTCSSPSYTITAIVYVLPLHAKTTEPIVMKLGM